MVSPAPKYVWVIRFNNQTEEEISPINPRETNYPTELDLIIPTNKGKSPNITDNIEFQALEFLGRVQKMCDRIKEECAKDKENSEVKSIEQGEEYLKNAKNINQSIQNLEKLVARFNEILKRLNKPPPTDNT